MTTWKAPNLQSLGSLVFPVLLAIGVGGGLLLRPAGFTAPNHIPALMRPSHISMVVADLDRAANWYEDKLRFTRISLPRQAGTSHVLLVRDSNVLELLDGSGSPGPIRLSGENLPPILVSRITLTLEDIDAEVAELKARGVDVVLEPRDAKNRDFRLSVIRDLDGRTIKLRQPL